MILLKNISYETPYKDRILTNISLEIKTGEFVVITGKSGSGKTTLGYVINGLIPHYYKGELKGSAYINGKNINEISLFKMGGLVGTVFQEPKNQFFMMDVFNEVAFGCSNMGLKRDDILVHTEKSLEVLGIKHLKERNIFNLSSGEKQKLAIASCNAMSPDVYLFDEPTANLDIASILDLKKILKLLKQKGKTVIVLEHRLFYLCEILDRMILLNNGKIEKEYLRNELINVDEKYLRSLFFDNIKVENCIKPNLNKMLFETKNLSYSFKDNTYLFKNISFCAYEKEIIGIIGKNGEGKTTFAKLCAGLLKETSGSILLDGKKLNYKKRLGKVYFVMQDSDLQLFSDTVKNELKICKIHNNISDTEIDEILSKFGIIDFKEKHPMTLSRGEKQRLTIATSFTSNSKVIFFDEPTSGLDKFSMSLISKNLIHLSSSKVIFVISHDSEFLLSVCTRIIQLKNGTFEQDFSLNDETKGRLLKLLELKE